MEQNVLFCAAIRPPNWLGSETTKGFTFSLRLTGKFSRRLATLLMRESKSGYSRNMPIASCEGIKPIFPGISCPFGAHDVEVAVNIGFVCVSFLRA